MNSKIDNQKEILKQNLEALNKSLERLLESYSICKCIGIKDKFTSQELREFESLTSRFARTLDLFINKGLRSLYKIELEDSGTIIDLLNKAEKREIIESAETWKKIKELRNSISHDYDIYDFTNDIFKPSLEYTPVIEKSIKTLNSYCEKYYE
jgi:flagellar motor switch protein FliM